jgi:hypothetical protein
LVESQDCRPVSSWRQFGWLYFAKIFAVVAIPCLVTIRRTTKHLCNTCLCGLVVQTPFSGCLKQICLWRSCFQKPISCWCFFS